MAAAGIRGIRLNLATGGGNDPSLACSLLQAALPRAAARNWHVQIFTNLAVIAGISALVRTAPVPVVLDHFGGAAAALGPAQTGFAELLALLRTGKAYVKISGACRASIKAPDYADAAPLARALIAANPERVVWGTDWPHTNSTTPPGRKVSDVTPLFQIDDASLLNQLPIWAGDAATRKAILVDNPARLYGF
jgi:predicted TIM-barrel fold metal-dependent hydrolase